jgi:hypothetical protein
VIGFIVPTKMHVSLFGVALCACHVVAIRVGTLSENDESAYLLAGKWQSKKLNTRTTCIYCGTDDLDATQLKKTRHGVKRGTKNYVLAFPNALKNSRTLTDYVANILTDKDVNCFVFNLKKKTKVYYHTKDYDSKPMLAIPTNVAFSEHKLVSAHTRNQKTLTEYTRKVQKDENRKNNQEYLDNLWNKIRIEDDTKYMTFGFGKKSLKLINHKEKLFSNGPKKYILAFPYNNKNLVEEHMKNEYSKSESCFVFTLKKNSEVWTGASKFVVIDKLNIKNDVTITPKGNMDKAWAKKVGP